MPLFKLRVQTADTEAGNAVEAVLSGSVAPVPVAVTLFETRPGCVVEAYYDTEPPLDVLRVALVVLDAGIGKSSLEAVPDLNWVALSQAALPPISAGRFIVHGSHHRARFAMRRYAIEIEAGEAFGTGHSATTALCLESIDVLARQRSFGRVLDLGCGTALLAIAAARALPKAQVLASDNDPLAIAVARANVGLNRANNRALVLAATGLNHPVLRRAQPFDLALANILPGPLIALAPVLRRAIRPGGVAVLCGILNHQAREVGATYRAAGFCRLRRRCRDGWTALTLIRGA